ncbi:unnamed protein product [Chironomus riparius]|uniref:Uncharacterized protein n=1 Tax=Chironomus riparius TaxID=315576 RepID=A0A9N9RVE0_9DIPT|nr:unnamed protein product [Chironomus riparius]
MDEKGKGTKSQDKIDFKELSVQNIAVAGTIKGQNVKFFLNTLKSLQFTTNSEVHFTSIGMKFIAEESQFFQGIAYFGSVFFSRYHFGKNLEMVNFGVDFTAFSEFLSAIINNELTSLKIVYYGDHRPIAFILKQKDDEIDPNATLSEISDNEEELVESCKEIVTEYIIRTKHSINPIDFSSINSPVASTVLMNCSEFIEIISDLDKTTDEIQFKIDSRSFIVRSLGIIQCNTQIPFPTDHKIFKNFNLVKDTKFSYKFSCFKCMLRALMHSMDVCLETRENGLLKVQIKGKTIENESSLFYEFNVMPNVTDEDRDIDVA